MYKMYIFYMYIYIYIKGREILITQVASCAMELLSVLARTRLRDFFIFPPVKCPKVLLFVTTNVRGNIALWSTVYHNEIRCDSRYSDKETRLFELIVLKG